MKKINGKYYFIKSRYINLDGAIKTDGVVQYVFDIFLVSGGLVVGGLPTREDAEEYLTNLETLTE